MLGARIRELRSHCAAEMMFPQKFHKRGRRVGLEGGEGVSTFSPELGRKTRPHELPNKRTFYEAPLSKKAAGEIEWERREFNVDRPQMERKSRVCKTAALAHLLLRKKYNKLGGERKRKKKAAQKDIQYPIQPRLALPYVVK